MPLSNEIAPVPNLPETAELDVFLGPAHPLVLLPVRLETRFFLNATGAGELRVRIYPDKIHVDTHEEKLTDEEVVWGKHFWEQTWRGSTDVEAEKVAWRQLVERFGSGRAAWIAKELRPTNPHDAPASPLTNDQPLPKPIRFPAVETKRESWTRAPLAKVLPTRWHVLGFDKGELKLKAAGTPIQKDLPAGPDPQQVVDDLPDTELSIDEGMKWMVDFANAEAVGMGIRIPLTADQAKGFDFLLVFGTRETTHSDEDVKELAALLNAHHYTNDLSFIAPGTPTNNTPDAPSGFTSVDPGHETSYQAERTGSQFQAGDQSFVDLMTSAFGFEREDSLRFATIGNARLTEIRDARRMNRALWPATLGYFVTQMMSSTPLTRPDADWARNYFTEYVRSGGPLPSFRVGKQPYGILPVTSFENWKPRSIEESSSREVALQKFLLRLRDFWRRKLAQVPRVGRTAGNPDLDFADMMSMDGLSANYTIRHLFGRAYLNRLAALFGRGSDQTFWSAKQEELTTAGLKLVGLDWKPTLARMAYSGWSTRLKGPLVQAEPLSETTSLKHNYIELLLKEADWEKIRLETSGQFQTKALLYSLLRQSLMLEYWTAAGELFMFQASNSDERFSDNDTDSEIKPVGTFSTWHLMNKTAREIAATIGFPEAQLTKITSDSFWKFLFELKTLPATPEIARRVSPLFEFRESLAALQNLSTASLERLMSGTLDLCSHRLDAWISSFANMRLKEMREGGVSKTLIGGYGWVLNLRPNTLAPSSSTSSEPLTIAGNPGFTHAPSLDHAATVAVLRSGHLSHSTGKAADANPLAIDLSSERVRLAEWLIDGIRQGQSLGALLGYRFERRLQDARLGDFIPAFREVAPLVAKRREAPEAEDAKLSAESIAANNVVDGLALKTRWASAKKTAMTAFAPNGPVGILLAQVEKKPGSARFQEQRARLHSELELLDDSVDAVSDALIAESVHQAVQGNPIRTASTLEAIARGAAPPPELEVARTPRTGTALIQRLVVLFSGDPVLPSQWPVPLINFRANAEPNLNAWAAKLLGDPARVRCVIERVDAETNSLLDSRELRLSELNLSPLDLIYATEGTRDGQPSEIQQRIMYAIRRQAGGFESHDVLRINPTRSADFSAQELSYGEFAEVLRCARALITGARGLNADELDVPERSRPASVDLSELTARADAASGVLTQTLADLNQLIAKANDSTSESLREAILRCGHFGLAGAVPVSGSGESPADRESLLAQANSLAKELARREDLLLALPVQLPPATGDDEQQKHQVTRLRAVFGDEFVVLPSFVAGNATELQQALAVSTTIQDNDALAVVTWFQRASKVRDGVARLGDSLRYGEVLNTGERLNLRVAQLPHDTRGRWVGLPLLPGQELSRSGLSLVVHSATDLDVSKTLAGLLIDEWIEVVPNVKETTGVTFQYDQPDAAPPQSILLAVPADMTRPWNLWSLSQTLLQTIDLARLRAVDLDAVGDLGHYLPALFFAVNQERETASLDFATLK